ncbi:MAG: hypothetical protein QM767_12315 [Anaeromyxobacter sp.]
MTTSVTPLRGSGPGSAADLFKRLWDELVALISTPATAALMRRALKRAVPRIPELQGVAVNREGLEYAFVLPAHWRDPARADAVQALRRLVREELEPLFRELTGPVVSRHLARVAELVEAGLAGEEDAG